MVFLKKKKEEAYEEYGPEEDEEEVQAPKYKYEAIDEPPQPPRRSSRPTADYQPTRKKQPQEKYAMIVQPQQIQIVDNETGEAQAIDPQNPLLVYQLLVEIKNDLDKIKGAVL
jgi:hypothetical protein